MIASFGDQATADLYNGRKSKKVRRFPHDICSVANRKLDMINYAFKLDDLKVPPGNRLETLKGKWKGYYSIRVNDQWRIIFQWQNSVAHNITLTDYH
jgi:proteic killer suppression protein